MASIHTKRRANAPIITEKLNQNEQGLYFHSKKLTIHCYLRPDYTKQFMEYLMQRGKQPIQFVKKIKNSL